MEVQHLYFQHRRGSSYFFKDLSFRLEPGKFHALQGKNGIGKSVLFNILCKKIEKGAVWQGKIVGENVTLVNQQFDRLLADQFSFLDNLKFGRLNRFPSPFFRLKSPFVPHSLIDTFRIDLSIPVSRLSGGQRQILALCMHLQRKTDVLLLDEPTAALDQENARLVFDFLKTLKNITILAVCHDMELLNRYVTGKTFQLEQHADGHRILC